LRAISYTVNQMFKILIVLKFGHITGLSSISCVLADANVHSILVYLVSTGDDSTDETALLQTWFKLVLEKNKLSRYESELMIL